MDHHFKREIADRYHAQLELLMELIEFDHELNYINQMIFCGMTSQFIQFWCLGHRLFVFLILPEKDEI